MLLDNKEYEQLITYDKYIRKIIKKGLPQDSALFLLSIILSHIRKNSSSGENGRKLSA